jgi:hypothetical protein
MRPPDPLTEAIPADIVHWIMVGLRQMEGPAELIEPVADEAELAAYLAELPPMPEEPEAAELAPTQLHRPGRRAAVAVACIAAALAGAALWQAADGPTGRDTGAVESLPAETATDGKEPIKTAPDEDTAVIPGPAPAVIIEEATRPAPETECPSLPPQPTAAPKTPKEPPPARSMTGDSAL